VHTAIKAQAAMRALWRPSAWGVQRHKTQRLAEIVRVLTSEGDRLHARVATVEHDFGSTQAVPEPVRTGLEAEPEIRRLDEAVRVLISDRDRLLTRIGSLERNFKAATASIHAAPRPRAGQRPS
jgi:hypothetical protein